MKRRTLDLMASAGGLLIAAILLVAGLLLTCNATFANTYVQVAEAREAGSANLEDPRAQLQTVTQQRDTVFEGESLRGRPARPYPPGFTQLASEGAFGGADGPVGVGFRRW